jgi:hypothetical protein
MKIANPIAMAMALLLAGVAAAADGDVRESKNKGIDAMPVGGTTVAVDLKKESKAAKGVGEASAAKVNGALPATNAAAGAPAKPAAESASTGAIVAGARAVAGARPIDATSAQPGNAPGQSGSAGKATAGGCKDPAKDGIYLKTLPDGSVELSNVPEGEQQQYDQLAIDSPCNLNSASDAARVAPMSAASGSRSMVEAQLGRAGGDDAAMTDQANADKGGTGSDGTTPLVVAGNPNPNRWPATTDNGHSGPPSPQDPPKDSPAPKSRITCTRTVASAASSPTGPNPVFMGATCNPTNGAIATGAQRGRNNLLAGSNPALSRRYRMMDRATYQQVVLGGTAGPIELPSACGSSGTQAQTETMTVDGNQCPPGWTPG